MNQNDLSAPIPQTDLSNMQPLPITPADDPLVCISDAFGGYMEFCPMYLLQGIPGATASFYVRKTVADMLIRAAKALPTGFKLKIFDTWRPLAVQKALFDSYYSRLQRRFPDKDHPALMQMTSLFICCPSEDPDRPFVHSTGGAVDLTVVDPAGNALDMGTGFDDFSDAAHTAYFENSGSLTVRNNRRLLYNAMLSAGFTNYPAEWWHYDYGDAFWAAEKKTNPIYQGIYTEPGKNAPEK